MSEKERALFKIKDNFASVELKPRESHMLAILVKMQEVPQDLHQQLEDSMNTIEAQPAAREVAEIFMGKKTLDVVSNPAHDLYVWLMLWAGKENEIPQPQPVAS